MSDSPANNMESKSVPGWTLVDNRGEIVSADEDSESSESSIEVISREDNEIVSHTLQRESSSVQADVVVTEDSPSADAASEDAPFDDVADTGKPEFSSPSGETAENAVNLLEAISDLDSDHNGNEAEIRDDYPTQADSVISESSNIQDNVALDGFEEQEVDCFGDGITAQFTTESQSTEACKMPNPTCETNFDQAQEYIIDNTATANSLLQATTEHSKESLPLGSTENLLHQFSLDSELEESKQDSETKAYSGACCMELLEGLEGEHAHHLDVLGAVDAKSQQIPAPVSFEEANILQVSDEGVAEGNHSSRSDSDTDSDYVRLDSENIDGYVGQHQNSGERVVIPLRLYRTGSSIGPSFSFMRSDAERNDNIPPNEDAVEVADQDRDDDTESSTEEGIDDRIESEQSETGSLSAHNDVGDLSVFADIGDLPLVTGNVPRNYIHRPNNHLSTVLNIIVVLVAILTMGISLGIIMATDLEIEEWQNAHEFQTRRVSQLEILLKSKTNANDYLQSRVWELDPQLTEARNYIRILEESDKTYERAFAALAAHSSLVKENFDTVLHTILAILDGVQAYFQCQEESNQMVKVECHLKFLPYLEQYTALLKTDKASRGMDISVGTRISGNKDVEVSTQDGPADDLTLLDSHPIIDDFQEPNNQELSNNQREFEAPSKKLNTVQTGSDKSEEQFPVSASKHSESRVEQQKSAKETIRALPVAIDIHQLQQSLTREQERALHWQQLYLAERRQRERERENEELEDEREREIAEKEREQIDHVECLRKLMSANLTTLTQHVVKWNVSVFDDFANLSVLLSGISELQQAVVDSVQRVWKSAEEVIDSFQGTDSIKEETAWENGVPKKEVVVEYLAHLADRIKEVDMPDHEVLVEYLGKMLDQVKLGVEDVLHEVYTESVTDSVYKLWTNAENIMKDFNSHKETTTDDENDGGGQRPDREQLLAYLSKVMDDICPRDSSASKAQSIKLDKEVHEDEIKSTEEVNPKNDNASENKIYNGTSPTGPNLETPYSGPYLDEEEPIQNGFWSRRLGKMLKKTGKTVRKLGRKVTGTWGKVKTMWREKKPLWHKLKNMWQEKKTVFFNAGDRFASSVMKASSKFANMCSKMSTNWFKSRESVKVDIGNKCVHKLRQHWQKMVLKDPCHVAGKFSYECNSGKKQCRKDLHKLSDSFYRLVKIANIKRDLILKLNINELNKYHKQFTAFQDQWGKSKFLLKTDVGWLDCQVAWWSAAITALTHGRADGLDENKCNTINLTDNFYDGQHGAAFDPYFSCNAKNSEKNAGFTDDEKSDTLGQDRRCGSSDQIDDQPVVEEGHNSRKGEGGFEGSIVNSDEAEIRETVSVNDDKLSRHHKHLSQDKEQAYEMFEQAETSEELNNKQHEDVDEGHHKSDWIFEKAKEREQLRAESSKSSWLFERANHRRDLFHQNLMNDYQDKHHKKGARKAGNWFMKQAEERRKIREEEHKSDWLFERAADRKKDRDDKRRSNFGKHDSRKPEQFRHVYGKVSTP